MAYMLTGREPDMGIIRAKALISKELDAWCQKNKCVGCAETVFEVRHEPETG